MEALIILFLIQNYKKLFFLKKQFVDATVILLIHFFFFYYFHAKITREKKIQIIFFENLFLLWDYPHSRHIKRKKLV